MALNYVTITGDFKDGQGNPFTGMAVFTPSQDVYAAGETFISKDQPLVVPIVSGIFANAVSLLATDNSGLVFTGMTKFFYWTVQLTLGGDSKAPWSFALPSSPASVDLFDLAGPVGSGGSGGGIAAIAAVDGSIVVDDTSSPVTLRTGSLDQIADLHPPAADLNVAGHKVTGLANGSGATDAVAFGQLGSAALQPSSAFIPTATAPTATPAPMLPLLYGGVWGYPYQFLPESYMSGLRVGQVATNVATNGTNVLTSSELASKAQVGDWVQVHGGNGATNGPVIGQITDITGSAVTLTTAATASVSNCPTVFGPDVTSAINAAGAAAQAYAIAHGYYGEILLQPSPYVSATLNQQSGAGLPTYNTQIKVPVPDAAMLTQKLVMKLCSPGDAGYSQPWNALVPSLGGGAAVVSMLTGPSTVDGTFGKQSVIGGPTGGVTDSGANGFFNTKFDLDGVMVVCPLWTNLNGIDARTLSGIRLERSSCHIFAPMGYNASAVGPYVKDIGATAFGSSQGVGLTSPAQGNNDAVYVNDFAVSGYEQGLKAFDHFVGGRIAAISCDVALKIDTTVGLSGTNHRVSVQQFSAENYNGGIRTVGSSGASAPFTGLVPIDIHWDAENSGAPIYDVNDTGDVLFGTLYFTDPVDQRGPIVTGATHLQVINDDVAHP